jgi:hypothetical protein
MPERDTETNQLISNLSSLIQGEIPEQEIPGAGAAVGTLPA